MFLASSKGEGMYLLNGHGDAASLNGNTGSISKVVFPPLIAVAVDTDCTLSKIYFEKCALTG